MRVVGGKVGADGRLFAYIVWTVPGGPAEKGGLQQGDKVCIHSIIKLIYHFCCDQIAVFGFTMEFVCDVMLGETSMLIWIMMKH